MTPLKVHRSILPVVGRTLVCTLPRCGSVSVLSAISARRGLGHEENQAIHRHFLSPWSHNWSFWAEVAKEHYDEVVAVVRHPVRRLLSARALLDASRTGLPRKWGTFLSWAAASTDPHVLSWSKLAARLGITKALKIEEFGTWGPEMGLTPRRANDNIYPPPPEMTDAELAIARKIYEKDFEFGQYQ